MVEDEGSIHVQGMRKDVTIVLEKNTFCFYRLAFSEGRKEGSEVILDAEYSTRPGRRNSGRRNYVLLLGANFVNF